jgi:hypothetical protein
MSDPTFTTRAELEAWARETAAQVAVVGALAMASNPEHAKRIYTRAIEQIRRVTVAHLPLLENADDR